ncbi:MAG TPA: hypothetical protein VF808_08160 [Ktedonobacterales bacterium]
MMSRDARYLAAAVEGILAWEWLVSGANKLISGTFPQGLGAVLRDGVKSNPNGWYVAFLQSAVIPHSVAFGYLIEISEFAIGVALLLGVILLLSPVRRKGDPQYRLALAEMSVAALASLACALLCINFHFFMGDGVFPGLDAANAFGEGISLDTLMPPLSLVILFVNVQSLCDMTGRSLTGTLRAAGDRLRALFGVASAPTTSHSA